MSELQPTKRTRIRRAPTRAVFDRKILNQILDEALLCHLGFNDNQQTYVIPTLCWRVENRLYVHGSTGSRMLKILRSGASVCITITLLDGLVMARSAFHHSANYRSAVILGSMQAVENEADSLTALEHFMEHIAPGRWSEVRAPNNKELKATDLFWISLDEVSVKVRTSDPADDDDDMDLPVWAGLIPVNQQFGPMVDAEDMQLKVATPDYSHVFGQRWVKS
jgi:nitroimidazol reductase NimA-like FMN-containing flavoprotein (pyridoxamine 5'-phosphate oxidase superfamily)